MRGRAYFVMEKFIFRWIEPKGMFYTPMQFLYFFVSVFCLLFIITGIGVVLQYIGLFSEKLSLIEILQMQFEITFVAVLFLVFGRFQDVPSSFTQKRHHIRVALQKRMTPKEYIQKIYISAAIQMIVYDYLLMNIYYHLYGRFAFLQGAHRIVVG